MPTFRHGRSTAVLVNAVDLTAFFNDGTVSKMMEPAEVTCYGNNSKAYIAGLMDGTINLSGFFSAASASEVDPILAGALQASADTNITYAPEGLTIGRNTYIMQALETSYEVASPVGDAVHVTADFQSDIGAWSAHSLHALSAETVSTNSTGVDELAATTTSGGVAVLHVTVNSMNNNTTFKVQHSTDNISFTDLITFTVVPTVTTTSQRATVATTTINRYVRCATTMAGTGSVTFSMSFARGQIA